ncbi:ABC transporter substrate-binding protein [Natronospirillum operosum]|uniref:ABC transporter substrate-binding protein n=1 Tax=Natronospirillum operosum TaxID=2759953 RepID=A0A4Z0WCW7_9GAMM|nr:extracellular solute-binding protein [Natronospirillum operosum]TGG91555.1 ABC transporter substrate-binding protein [Natronospirillum operosum]
MFHSVRLPGHQLGTGLLVTCLMLSAAALAQATDSPEMIRTHALSILGEPKYDADFEHFDYVNPDAPQGGRIVFAAIGTYDNFNRYAQRGLAATGSTLFYDSLMTASSDEIRTYYPLVAQELEYASDYSEVTFFLNPDARHQDGEPLTAADIVFTFHKFMDEGVPFVRSQYAAVADVEALDDYTVRYTFHPDEGSRDLILRIANMPILPEHFWAERDFSEPLNEPPLGSGPYRVSRFAMGQHVEYERLEDYWARDLPAMRGTMNFDYLRYDYYRDTTVALEAFKAGEYDFRQENVARQWANDYTGRAFDRGDIVKEELPHSVPQPMQAFVFNIERDQFQDHRVRQALNYALDFEWMNRNLFFDQYERTFSYFQNTPYMAEGLPSEQELEILEPFRDQLPEAVFSEEAWRPNVTDGTGRLRAETREALGLLQEAGWELRDQRLVHSETGERFRFEMLLSSPTFERVALNIQRNVERMGIRMDIRIIDPSQFTNRLRERDFDVIANGYAANPYPSVSMQTSWHSDYIDSTWNTAGVSDPVIDALIEGIIAHQGDEDRLLAYGHAFDRVARWNFYVMPNWHSSSYMVAYWDKFDRPETRPDFDLGVSTWWYDNDRAARIRR